jgi:hypothetical protein
MNYWRHIDVGDHNAHAMRVFEHIINGKIDLQSCRFWNPIDKNEVARMVPDLITGLQPFGIVREMVILVIRGDQQITIHTDHTSGLNKGVQARINVPILNCEGSLTSFFHFPVDVRDNYETNVNGTRLWPMHYRELYSPVSSVALTVPTIIRTAAPHTVYCNTNKYPRITLTISMEEDVEKFL